MSQVREWKNGAVQSRTFINQPQRMHSSNEASLRWYSSWLLDFRGEKPKRRRQTIRVERGDSTERTMVRERQESGDCSPISPRHLLAQTRDWICRLVRSFSSRFFCYFSVIDPVLVIDRSHFINLPAVREWVLTICSWSFSLLSRSSWKAIWNDKLRIPTMYLIGDHYYFVMYLITVV